jgi:plasmid replication initiation protein
MRKFLTFILEKLTEKLREKEPIVTISEGKKDTEEKRSENRETAKKSKPKEKSEIAHYKGNPARDLIEMMEVPFLALSKNRKNPIIYESQDGRVKVKVSRHTGHFLASIYDWDIILFVANKMQEILNSGTDIPPRTMTVPRHEILKAIHKYNVNSQQKEIENSLSRLKLTGIETTIRNEDYRYKGGFGYLDSWCYTERKDIKEIQITLSQWLYDGICAKGALLKVDSAYFDITSGLKKFLYRTARKHVGNSKETWEFSAEKLYEKSGSEREFRKFINDLKATVLANDIPEYSLKWIQKNKKKFVVFKRSQIGKIESLLENMEKAIEEENNENQRKIS